MHVLPLLALLLFFSNTHAELLWPLPGSQTITGGYADTRPDHFHGGVDLRTRGMNLKIVAPDDGWVERLAVNPSGYGRVLYFRMQDGRTAVFAHLSRFADGLEKMLRDSQLVGGTYRIEIPYDTPAPERTFKRGETLAFPGQTGAGPPHLHFEVREGSVQTDPLANYTPFDKDPPVIVKVGWIPLSGFTPQTSGRPLTITANSSRLWKGESVRAAEPVAFFLQTYDPGPWGRHAVPSVLRVKIGDNTVFISEPARIDIAGPRDIYQKVVWAARKQTGSDIRRLFNMPPPVAFLDTARDGRGWLRDLKDETVFIEVEDRAGNISRVQLNVTAGGWPKPGRKTPPRQVVAGTFAVDANESPAGGWVDLDVSSLREVRIRPDDFAFTDRVRLSYCCSEQTNPGRLFFYELTGKGRQRPLWLVPGTAPDSLACMILRGGTYGVAADDTPPELTLSIDRKRLKFKLKDVLSSIDDSRVRCTVDGETAIAEYEYDEGGGYIWTPKPLSRGRHAVTFSAADRAGNHKTWTLDIQIP